MAAEKKGQSGQAGGKGRGGEKWRDRGRDGEERKNVDFAPLARTSASA